MSVLYTDFYFVPFGREPGGFLDILSLSPNVKEATATTAFSNYLKEKRNEVTEQGKELRKRYQAEEITKEERDHLYAQCQQKLSDHEADLNELRARFENQLASQRKMAKEGHYQPTVIWRKTYGGKFAGPQRFWEFLSRRRPMSSISSELRTQIINRWIYSRRPRLLVPASREGAEVLNESQQIAYLSNEAARKKLKTFQKQRTQSLDLLNAELNTLQKKGMISSEEQALQHDAAKASARLDLNVAQAARKLRIAACKSSDVGKRELPHDQVPPNTFSELMSDKVDSKSHIDLATAINVAKERTLINVLTADALWTEVPHTNRQYWREVLEQWNLELNRTEPQFSQVGEPVRVSFPTLSEFSKLSIDTLDRETMEIVDQPDRSQMTEQIDGNPMADIIRRMAESMGGEADDAEIEKMLSDMMGDT